MTVTTHDITIDNISYIMEITLNDNGSSYITLTQACFDREHDSCDLITYDFKEVQ